MKRINAVNVCGTIAFLSLFGVVGFTDGGNYIAAVISLIVFAVFSYVAARENGDFRKKNRT